MNDIYVKHRRCVCRWFQSQFTLSRLTNVPTVGSPHVVVINEQTSDKLSRTAVPFEKIRPAFANYRF